ncbi:MAG: hypothetical protein IKE01_06615 [Clostridia bacterium]|nr:hypothetical protein [Clostridia bacterium]
MQVPNIFKQTISDIFYDKSMEIWTVGEETDNEGSVIKNGKLENIDEFQGNFQLSTREYIQQEYGQEIEANAIVTCNDNVSASINDILTYNQKDYVIKSVIKSDSHLTLLVKGDN